MNCRVHNSDQMFRMFLNVESIETLPSQVSNFIQTLDRKDIAMFKKLAISKFQCLTNSVKKKLHVFSFIVLASYPHRGSRRNKIILITLKTIIY